MRPFLAALALAGALILDSAQAHDSWISREGHRNTAGEWCCGEGDCFMLPPGAVRATPGGYRVMWTAVVNGKDASGVEVVPYSEAQPSPDGEYWRCKRPDGTRRCFFAPPPTD